MVANEIQRRMDAKPFEPFTIHLTDGRQVPIADRWHVMVSPCGHTVVVATPEDSFDHHDVKTVTNVTDGLPAATA